MCLQYKSIWNIPLYIVQWLQPSKCTISNWNASHIKGAYSFHTPFLELIIMIKYGVSICEGNIYYCYVVPMGHPIHIATWMRSSIIEYSPTLLRHHSRHPPYCQLSSHSQQQWPQPALPVFHITFCMHGT